MRANSFRHLCVLFLCLGAVPGCDDGGYDAPPVKTPFVDGVKPAPTLGLNSEIKPDGKPNQYSVTLTWRGTYQAGNWIIRRTEGKSNTVLLEALPEASSYFTDKTTLPGTQYRYELGMNGRDGFYPISEISVLTPKDLVVTGRMILSDAGPYSRAFFTENSILVTNGTPLKLELKEIVSLGGVIETFPDGAKSAPGVAGKTPETIQIYAERGTGQLRINTRGERGGDGTDGQDGVKGATGLAGAPGDWGMNPELYKNQFANGIEAEEREMRRQPWPPGHEQWKSVLGAVRRFICARLPGNGARGAGGTAGTDGSDGGNGGNSGSVNIKIAEGDMLVTVHPQPGTAGLAGRLGKGGEGGDGGVPGALDVGHVCPPAKTGDRGSSGLDGRQGRIGERGVTSPSCIRLKQTATGECEKF